MRKRDQTKQGIKCIIIKLINFMIMYFYQTDEPLQEY